MNRKSLCCGVLVAVAMAGCVAPVIAQKKPTLTEQAAVHRNLGKAYFDNCIDLDRAAEEFLACLEIEPDVAANHVNLAMVYVCSEKYDQALQYLASAAELDPSLLAIPYNRGLVYKRQRNWENAIGEFNKVLAEDPDCVPCLHMVAVCQAELGAATDAIATFERVIELAPLRISAHYTLARLLIKQGNRDRAKLLMQIFRDFQNVVPNSERQEEWLEKSRYTEVIFPPSPSDVQKERSPRFREEPERIPALPQRCVFPLFFDADADGDVDLFLTAAPGPDAPNGCFLLENNGSGKFEDTTTGSGLEVPDLGVTAAAGDIDNDGYLDLFVGTLAGNRLFRNRGDGTFDHVTQDAGFHDRAATNHACFVDYDHDSDLDLLIAKTGTPEATPADGFLLYRNRGVPDTSQPVVFDDATDQAGLPRDLWNITDLAFADLDRNGGTDLCVAHDNGPTRYFANLRGGRLAERPGTVKTDSLRDQSVQVGDINGDGHFDLVIAGSGSEGVDRVVTLLGNREGTFRRGKDLIPFGLTPPISQILLFDFDNSGDLDLLVVGAGTLIFEWPGFPETDKGKYSAVMLFRGNGDGSFSPSDSLPKGPFSQAKSPNRAAVADIDGDCDLDILLTERTGEIHVLWNDGNGAGSRVPLKLIGTKGNRDGIGARIEVYAGTFRRALSVIDTNPHIPIGHRDRLDAITILWPSGMVQSATHPDVAPCSVLEVIETPAAIESCPSLYVETADGMAYVTDLMGTSALGLPTGPHSYLLPEPREILKIEGPIPHIEEGRLKLVIAQELCEIVYLDSVAVEVWDRPAELTLVSDLRFSPSLPAPDRILALKNILHPASARPPGGTEVSSSLQTVDLVFPTGFVPLIPRQYTGLSQPYTLELDFGPDPGSAGSPVLVAYGHSLWPSENLCWGMLQNETIDLEIPTVEVRDGDGSWQRIPGEFAFPALKPKSIALPLPPWEEHQRRQVRISTNLITYWDEIFVGEEVPDPKVTKTTLTVAKATLSWHGYSRHVAPHIRDYQQNDGSGPWLPIPGHYTAYGDVTPSLTGVDDQLTIYAPGEAVTLEFSTEHLPPIPDGWERDYFLVTEGWTKGNSYSTGGSGSTKPVPFREMTAYPFSFQHGKQDEPTLTDNYQRTVAIPTWAGMRQ